MVKTYKCSDTSKLSMHFSVSEFRCKCGGQHDTLISDELVTLLEKLYAKLDCSKIVISSGFRCAKHDKNVGGSGTGQHTKGNAADICCYAKNGAIISSKLVCCTAQDLGFTGIANINADYTYTHVDVRNGKWYGDETKGNSYCIPKPDFYSYFGIEKEVKGMNGIDISYCQKKVDWAKVNVDFVIIRAGYGRYTHQKDTMFEDHYAGAKQRGIPVGAYWYSYAKSEEDARKEADACLEILKGKQFEYPIYYDVEEKDTLNLGKDKVSAIIRAFLERVEAAGYWVGLYMSRSPLETYVADDIRTRYAIWVAEWGVTKPTYKGQYGMWQTGTGTVKGFPEKVDTDICYQDYPTQIKAKGLNGYGKEPDPPAPETKYFEITVDGKTYAGNLSAL